MGVSFAGVKTIQIRIDAEITIAASNAESAMSVIFNAGFIFTLVIGSEYY
jgi:hypothetical protein